VADDLLPELTALQADVIRQLGPTAPFEEVQRVMLDRIRATQREDVSDPLARAAVAAIAHRQRRGFIADRDTAQVANLVTRGADELIAEMREWQAQRERLQQTRRDSTDERND
jgi:hypothetical protein